MIVALYMGHRYKLVFDLFLILWFCSWHVLDQELLASVFLAICIVKVTILLAVYLIGSARVLFLDMLHYPLIEVILHSLLVLKHLFQIDFWDRI